VAGNALLVMTGAGPVVKFLGTGPGVLTVFAVAVFLILLGVAFLTRATPQPIQSVAVVQQAGTAQADRDRDEEVALLAILIFAAAILYSSLDHAEASGYLAAMARVGVAPAVMKPTALALNILVAAIATVSFYRAS
jgi:Mn2+/Fe2+ NRAMP family transporter